MTSKQTKAYYRGAMGILLVYDVTDEKTFNNIRNWIRNIEKHATENVNKILIGNKCDMVDKKVFFLSFFQMSVHSFCCLLLFSSLFPSFSLSPSIFSVFSSKNKIKIKMFIFKNQKVIDADRGQALANEYGIKFVETSAKNSINVEEAFVTLAQAIKERLIDTRNGDAPKDPTPAPPTDGGIVVVDQQPQKDNKPQKDGCC